MQVFGVCEQHTVLWHSVTLMSKMSLCGIWGGEPREEYVTPTGGSQITDTYQLSDIWLIRSCGCNTVDTYTFSSRWLSLSNALPSFQSLRLKKVHSVNICLVSEVYIFEREFLHKKKNGARAQNCLIYQKYRRHIGAKSHHCLPPEMLVQQTI